MLCVYKHLSSEHELLVWFILKSLRCHVSRGQGVLSVFAFRLQKPQKSCDTLQAVSPPPCYIITACSEAKNAPPEPYTVLLSAGDGGVCSYDGGKKVNNEPRPAARSLLCSGR
ncbi:hypothetical protein CHARACLAT_020113 [Characodon lateralis]|uniref:Uncharacterized protein n=1 Tax=Characodon lateralis TaxID=208331 RepID=A0ABU7EBE9_9TELE|nr:hypothetical protein [Characodon lateralis]